MQGTGHQAPEEGDMARKHSLKAELSSLYGGSGVGSGTLGKAV